MLMTMSSSAQARSGHDAERLAARWYHESLQAMSAVAAREDRLPDLKHVFSDALWMKTRFP